MFSSFLWLNRGLEDRCGELWFVCSINAPYTISTSPVTSTQSVLELVDIRDDAEYPQAWSRQWLESWERGTLPHNILQREVRTGFHYGLLEYGIVLTTNLVSPAANAAPIRRGWCWLCMTSCSRVIEDLTSGPFNKIVRCC